MYLVIRTYLPHPPFSTYLLICLFSSQPILRPENCIATKQRKSKFHIFRIWDGVYGILDCVFGFLSKVYANTVCDICDKYESCFWILYCFALYFNDQHKSPATQCFKALLMHPSLYSLYQIFWKQDLLQCGPWKKTTTKAIIKIRIEMSFLSLTPPGSGIASKKCQNGQLAN